MGLEEYTSTELLKEINSIKNKHDSLKSEILSLINDIESIENLVNNKISELTELEDNYVILIEEFNKRT